MKPDELKAYWPTRIIKRKVRDAAVRRVRRDLLLSGQSEDDFSAQDLEYLLADSEQSVWSDIKRTSLLGALVMLGLSVG